MSTNLRLFLRFPERYDPYEKSLDRTNMRWIITNLADVVCSGHLDLQLFYLENHPAVVPLLQGISDDHTLRMIKPKRLFTTEVPNTQYNAGVFLGGDASLLDDYEQFQQAFPQAKILSFHQSGGSCVEIPSSPGLGEKIATDFFSTAIKSALTLV